MRIFILFFVVSLCSASSKNEWTASSCIEACEFQTSGAQLEYNLACERGCRIYSMLESTAAETGQDASQLTHITQCYGSCRDVYEYSLNLDGACARGCSLPKLTQESKRSNDESKNPTLSESIYSENNEESKNENEGSEKETGRDDDNWRGMKMIEDKYAALGGFEKDKSFKSPEETGLDNENDNWRDMKMIEDKYAALGSFENDKTFKSPDDYEGNEKDYEKYKNYGDGDYDDGVNRYKDYEEQELVKVNIEIFGLNGDDTWEDIEENPGDEYYTEGENTPEDDGSFTITILKPFMTVYETYRRAIGAISIIKSTITSYFRMDEEVIAITKPQSLFIQIDLNQIGSSTNYEDKAGYTSHVPRGVIANFAYKTGTSPTVIVMCVVIIGLTLIYLLCMCCEPKEQLKNTKQHSSKCFMGQLRSLYDEMKYPFISKFHILPGDSKFQLQKELKYEAEIMKDEENPYEEKHYKKILNKETPVVHNFSKIKYDIV